MENLKIPPKDLPFNFDGVTPGISIRFGEIECPGVYSVMARKQPFDMIGAGYYVVMPDSPAISQKAREFGIPLPSNPQVRIYCCDSFHDHRHRIIEYEIQKYLTQQNKGRTDWDLQIMEAVGMDECPEYFGEVPVPTDSPWGSVLQNEKFGMGFTGLKQL